MVGCEIINMKPNTAMRGIAAEAVSRRASFQAELPLANEILHRTRYPPHRFARASTNARPSYVLLLGIAYARQGLETDQYMQVIGTAWVSEKKSADRNWSIDGGVASNHTLNEIH